MTSEISAEVSYVALLFGLFVVPKVLQRWRIPAAITSVALGAIAGPGLGLFEHDETVALLSTLGIVALFLFAGLEVDLAALRRESRTIGEHLVVRLLALAGGAAAVVAMLPLDGRSALLVSLALLTPSTGFILDSLPHLGLTAEAAFWVRAKAIATEIVALGVMFVALQSDSVSGFIISTAALLSLIVVVPLLFQAFGRFVAPYAPKTEFAFLLMVSLVSAFATKKLGVYYLVGAFVVGMVAQRFRTQLPAIASEKMLNATEAFASIFVPFYFFHAGLILRPGDFSPGALLFGVIALLVAVPLRIALVAAHRKLALGESVRESLKVGVPMTPTLVFTLVIAQILRERVQEPTFLFGGLVIYALVNTAIPSLFFRSPTPEFETPELPPLAGAAASRESTPG